MSLTGTIGVGTSGAAAACAAVRSTQSQPIIIFVSKLLLCVFSFLIFNS